MRACFAATMGMATDDPASAAAGHADNLQCARDDDDASARSH